MVSKVQFTKYNVQSTSFISKGSKSPARVLDGKSALHSRQKAKPWLQESGKKKPTVELGTSFWCWRGGDAYSCCRWCSVQLVLVWEARVGGVRKLRLTGWISLGSKVSKSWVFSVLCLAHCELSLRHVITLAATSGTPPWQHGRALSINTRTAVCGNMHQKSQLMDTSGTINHVTTNLTIALVKCLPLISLSFPLTCL